MPWDEVEVDERMESYSFMRRRSVCGVAVCVGAFDRDIVCRVEDRLKTRHEKKNMLRRRRLA